MRLAPLSVALGYGVVRHMAPSVKSTIPEAELWLIGVVGIASIALQILDVAPDVQDGLVYATTPDFVDWGISGILALVNRPTQ